MKKKLEQLKADVLDEMEAIEQVLKNLSFLKNNLESDETDTVQKAAVGTFLLNFYVGIENIVKRISKEYYRTMPKGSKELLDLSHTPPQGKTPVFSRDIADRLNPYRGFRHLFVSGYGFNLRLELMTSLIDNIDLLWDDIKKAIEEFWNKM